MKGPSREHEQSRVPTLDPKRFAEHVFVYSADYRHAVVPHLNEEVRQLRFHEDWVDGTHPVTKSLVRLCVSTDGHHMSWQRHRTGATACFATIRHDAFLRFTYKLPDCTAVPLMGRPDGLRN